MPKTFERRKYSRIGRPVLHRISISVACEAAVSAGCGPYRDTKHPGEVALAVEAKAQGDFGQRQLRSRKQRTRRLGAAAVQVVVHRAAELALELARNVNRMHAGHVRQRVEPVIFSVRRPQVIA